MFSSNASQVSNDVKYIEDVCSVYLRTGTGSSQTVTTGIKENTGALVISKSRSAATDWAWYDTFRGATYDLVSNSTAAQTTQSQGLTAFNADGHTWGTLAKVNTNGATYVDTVLKPTPKFFDVVTYTGTGSAITLNHNLGSVPGCIIVKNTTSAQQWNTYHRSLNGGTNPEQYYVILNTTAASAFGSNQWNSTAPTSTQFTVGSSNSSSGDTYVAYLFAHNAGGFGLTGTDNVISCGSYTGNGSTSGPAVTLGYEPQWLLVKNASATRNWFLVDNMRGLTVGGVDPILQPNSASAEQSSSSYDYFSPTATGFSVTNSDADVNGSGNTYIYIAIRRGPMKVPTSGTSVFYPNARTGNGGTQTVSGLSFSPDLWMTKNRGNSQNNWSFDRLRGPNQPLSSNLTDSESTNTSNWFGGSPIFTPTNTGFTTIGQAQVNTSSGSYIDWLFGRAPSFFDEVCFTSSGSFTYSGNHNLTVVPELVILKPRDSSGLWRVVSTSLLGNSTNYVSLNYNSQVYPASGSLYSATSTTISFTSYVLAANTTYVCYLFATCAGVSKCGTYTGTGTTLQIDCGFTGGARFVLIKRTDADGDWYVWDSARGIVSGNDPYLLLNSTAAEVTNTDYVDTYSAGFEISSTAPAAINANGGTFIFLAIA